MKALAEQIGDIDGVEIYGRVVGVRGLMIEVAGPLYAMSVGSRLTIEGVAAIQSGANPHLVAEKLRSLLPADQQAGAAEAA